MTKKRNYNTKENGGWTHKNCFKPKTCAVCYNFFTPFSGVHKFCSEKCRGRWGYITGTKTTESQYSYISGNWRRYLNRLCCRTFNRSNLKVEDVLEILKNQDYQCALSGRRLTCTLEKGKRFYNNASIDRIEAGGPYIKENIQLVCSGLNSLRRDMNVNDFIEICKEVAKYNE